MASSSVQGIPTTSKSAATAALHATGSGGGPGTSSSAQGIHTRSKSAAAPVHAPASAGGSGLRNSVCISAKNNIKQLLCSSDSNEVTTLKPRRLSAAADTSRKCTVGCPILDAHLRGGIPCGSVTELVGESTSAKTQFCLQMALAVQAPLSDGGMGGRSLYIFTEGYFPMKRLWQIASTLRKPTRVDDKNAMNCPQRSPASPVFPSQRPPPPPPCPPQCATNGMQTTVCATFQQQYWREPLFWSTVGSRRGEDPRAEERARIACSNVLVEGIHTPDELLSLLRHLRSAFSGRSRRPLPLRMIIIDSIAALFRSEFDNTILDMSNRASILFQVAGELKRIASEFQIPVLLTNQVTDYIEGEGAEGGSSLAEARIGNLSYMLTSGRRVVAALGLAWCSCITTRLFLSRSTSAFGITLDGSQAYMRRRMQVVFAPHLPPTSCEFVVERCGLRGLVS
ncbi:hypothetical protein CBR_g28512 [Chara braunii]|uniref:RecA family profile 1 domain-containing protein n=1 Tax=Chara braunii TaxID=69332 RepID=A0A388JW56_CHABU|nr:hypothetical protein CBR_g28512 [Chara braunii]|eukprot:GBG62036.1 hypothetical protein CBR_g28512 [Chara braunii]